MKKKLITMGELLLRFTPPGHDRFLQADTYEVAFGGAEANVAVSAENYGIDASYVTKLPDNEVGQAAINSLKRLGIETENIARGGKRIGTYYFERGAGLRPSKIIYDRENSSIAEADPDDFDWGKIFDGADWFHFSGITPALSKNARDVSLRALKEAKKKGVRISVDLNYRSRMCTLEEAGKSMDELCHYADVCITSDDDAEIFAMYPEDKEIPEGKPDLWNFRSVCTALKERFDFDEVCVMRRRSLSATKALWDSMLLDSVDFHFGKKYDVDVIDTVGCGDAFCGGFIAAELLGFTPQDKIDFASAAGCLKHTISGDFNMVTKDEVIALMGGDSSGAVKR